MWRVWELYAERAWYSEDNREVSYEALNRDDDPFTEEEVVEFDCFFFESRVN